MPNHAVYQNGKGDATNVLHKFDDSAIYELIAGDKWQEVNQFYSAQEQWDLLATAYKNAADYIVDGLLGALPPGHHGLYIAGPVMFLYRHYLELQLKTLLLDLRKFENTGATDTLPGDHSLLQIWRSVKQLLSKIEEARFSKADRAAGRTVYLALEDRIKEFNDVDGNSMRYRYPVDLAGRRKFAKLPNPSQLAHVKEIIEVMSGYFGGIQTWIHEERNADLEMQREAREIAQEMEGDWPWY